MKILKLSFNRKIISNHTVAIIKEKNIEIALNLAKDEIKYSVPTRFFNEVVLPLNFVLISDTTIYVSAKNSFTKNQLDSEWKDKILKKINDHLDSKFSLQIITENDRKTLLNKIKDSGSVKTNNLAVNFNKKTGINKQLTFDCFVVGSFNENIYEIGKSLVKNTKWKNFCVVGDIGQGKTHFLNAFGNLWFDTHKTSKIKYVTGEEFVREFYNAFQGGLSTVVQKLKDEYSSYDLLIFDDFQFINKKNKINEILLSIVANTKNQNQKFVFGMIDYPNSFLDIDKKLISILRSGLVYKFNKPSREDFKKILLSIVKNYDSTYLFSDEALNFIVNRCQNDLRVLEGITQRLMFSLMNKISGEKLITIETIRKNVSSEIFDINPKLSDVDPKIVIDEICNVYNVDPSVVISKSQEKIITHVRHVCVYVLKEKLDLGWVEIGKILGSRAHSTVIEGYKKIKKIINKDLSLKSYIEKIYEKI